MLKPFAQKIKQPKALLARIRRESSYERLGNHTGIHHITAYHPRGGLVEGLKICYLSDTHFGPRNKIDYESYTCLFSEDFDLVLLGGDIIDKGPKDLDIGAQNLLKGLQARLGKYYVHGNHERREAHGCADMDVLMQELGYTSLEEHVFTHGGLTIAGLLWTPQGISRVSLPENTFNIVISHTLDELTAFQEHKIDIFLSGHIHAGEIALGPINGVNQLILTGTYKNLNKQKGLRDPWKQLDDRCLSFIHPAMTSHAYNHYGLPRFGTRQAGVVILEIKQA